MLRYFRGQEPTAIREEIAGTTAWLQQAYRRPSEVTARIVIPDRMKSGAKEEGPLPEELNVGLTPASVSAAEPATAETMNATDPSKLPEPAISWAYPGIDSLLSGDRAIRTENTSDQNWLKEIESRTKAALQQFQLQAKLVKSVLTPNSALLKFARECQPHGRTSTSAPL